MKKKNTRTNVDSLVYFGLSTWITTFEQTFGIFTSAERTKFKQKKNIICVEPGTGAENVNMLRKRVCTVFLSFLVLLLQIFTH